MTILFDYDRLKVVQERSNIKKILHIIKVIGKINWWDKPYLFSLLLLEAPDSSLNSL